MLRIVGTTDACTRMHIHSLTHTLHTHSIYTIPNPSSQHHTHPQLQTKTINASR